MTLDVWGRVKIWEMPLVEEFDLLECIGFEEMEREFKGPRERLERDVRWWEAVEGFTQLEGEECVKG